ncbi:MAG: hypothetical protein AVDCRST_MAG49-2468 [uncultured Thermomicrobiales bacterium]|uniref:Uncharacterized protein n=1 Tax=uncultured Thermomicrobiales bacterium TaxID=1645740 RepID=A0A6J4UYK4_9BACT|nr:MAG: hypothetical protein AVDCRST_MAG49-2468 [uncultured Thermomicrobiales bacterium]
MVGARARGQSIPLPSYSLTSAPAPGAGMAAPARSRDHGSTVPGRDDVVGLDHGRWLSLIR